MWDLAANDLAPLGQPHRRPGAGLFGHAHRLAPLQGAPPEAGIGNRQPTDLVENLFGEIVLDLTIEPDRLLRDRFTPMLFVDAQLVVEGEKDPPHSVSSSNNRA